MITAKDISYHYAGSRRQVFDNFSFTLSENRIYGLLGKNGTGKSTLLYLICGLLRQQKGTIEIDGVDTRKHMADMLKDILFPKNLSFPPFLWQSMWSITLSSIQTSASKCSIIVSKISNCHSRSISRNCRWDSVRKCL